MSLSELLNTTETNDYLHHLTTLSLETLQAESGVLQTQSHHLTSSLTNLTHTSYPAFLRLHDTTSKLGASLSAFETSLDGLINSSLPELEEASLGWKDRTEGVLKERRKARGVLEVQDRLRDLLDVPILVDTCARNGFYKEALQLSSHVHSVASKHKDGPPLVLRSVLEEVDSKIRAMEHSLLATLYEPGRKLPALWKAVSFLRKMEAFDEEEEVALAFLTGRHQCLVSSLEPLQRDITRLLSTPASEDAGDLARTLKKYIDTWREGVYDLVTQFNSIFPPPGAPNSTLPPSSPLANSSFSAMSDSKDAGAATQILLHQYATHTIHTHLVPVLRSCLGLDRSVKTPPPPIPFQPLLNQLNYLSNAWARLGLDFRGILPRIFEDAVVVSFSSGMSQASESFIVTLAVLNPPPKSRQSTMLNGGMYMSRKAIPQKPLAISTMFKFSSTFHSMFSSTFPGFPTSSDGLASYSLASTPPTTISPTTTPISVPPSILTHTPPLATLLNTFIETLNTLRAVPATRAYDRVESALEDSILSIWEYPSKHVEGKDVQTKSGILFVIQNAVNSRTPPGEESEDARKARESEILDALRLGHVFLAVLVAWVRRALSEGVYGRGKVEVNGNDPDDHPDVDDEQETERRNDRIGIIIRDWEGWVRNLKV